MDFASPVAMAPQAEAPVDQEAPIDEDQALTSSLSAAVEACMEGRVPQMNPEAMWAGRGRFGQKQANASSSLRGVSWSAAQNKWLASVTGYKAAICHLGYFDSEHKAGMLFDLAVLKLRGLNTPTNFQTDGPDWVVYKQLLPQVTEDQVMAALKTYGSAQARSGGRTHGRGGGRPSQHASSSTSLPHQIVQPTAEPPPGDQQPEGRSRAGRQLKSTRKWPIPEALAVPTSRKATKLGLSSSPGEPRLPTPPTSALHRYYRNKQAQQVEQPQQCQLQQFGAESPEATADEGDDLDTPAAGVALPNAALLSPDSAFSSGQQLVYVFPVPWLLPQCTVLPAWPLNPDGWGRRLVNPAAGCTSDEEDSEDSEDSDSDDDWDANQYTGAPAMVAQQYLQVPCPTPELPRQRPPGTWRSP